MLCVVKSCCAGRGQVQRVCTCDDVLVYLLYVVKSCCGGGGQVPGEEIR